MRLQPLHNEKELLYRLMRSDEKAFSDIFYAYHNPLGEFVLLLTESPEFTEEIIQDVFLKVWEKRAMLNNIEKFTSWLFILTRNYTLNSLRKLSTEEKKQQAYGQETGQIQVIQNDTFDSGQNFESLIETAVAQLPPQQQRAYRLKLYDELSYADIAKQMNLSRDSVKKYLQWASKSVCAYVKKQATLMEALMLFYIIF